MIKAEASPASFLAANMSICELAPGGRYALWGFRACAAGHGRCVTLHSGFARAFGQNAGPALSALQDLACELGGRGRRTIAVAAPGWVQLTADETSILAALAASQRHDVNRRDAHLTWLFAGAPTAQSIRVIDRIASLFAICGLRIVQPGEASVDRGQGISTLLTLATSSTMH